MSRGGKACGRALARSAENERIAAGTDPTAKIARLAGELVLNESDIRSSALPETRLVEMFNEHTVAYKRGLQSLTAWTLLMLPSIFAAGAASQHSKAGACAIIASEILLGVGSILYPCLKDHRIINEIRNAPSGSGP